MVSTSTSSTPAQQMLPPGVVFDPTDEQLVFDYLIKKGSGHVHGKGFHYFRDLDIYKHDPSELSILAHDSGHEKLYFFTPLHKKGKNAARQVPGGFWKKTGTFTGFKGRDGKPIAKKTSLAYYKNDQTSESVKGQWLMKEYMLLESELPHQNDQDSKKLTALALCVVYYKPHCKSRNDTI